MRPPSTFVVRYVGTGPGDCSIADLAFPAGPADLTVAGSYGPGLHLQGILFEAAANGLNFARTPSTVPTTIPDADAPGGVVPAAEAGAAVTAVISAPAFYATVPGKIMATTTAFPFELHYGPLGIGGR